MSTYSTSARQTDKLFTLVSDANRVSFQLSPIFPFLGEIVLVSQCGLDYTPIAPTVKRQFLKKFGFFLALHPTVILQE
jgi:hypothetical protein